MRTFNEWQDVMNGYQLFMELFQSPTKDGAQVFCDWLEDVGLVDTSQYIRYCAGRKGEHPHGYWDAMASELKAEGIKLSSKFLTHNDNRYRLLHDRVVVQKNNRWVDASESEIMNIYPGLAVMMFYNTHDSNIDVDEDYKARFLYGHFNVHLAEMYSLEVESRKTLERLGRLPKRLLDEIARVVQEVNSTIEQIPDQYRSRFNWTLQIVAERATLLHQYVQQSDGNQTLSQKVAQALWQLSQIEFGEV